MTKNKKVILHSFDFWCNDLCLLGSCSEVQDSEACLPKMYEVLSCSGIWNVLCFCIPCTEWRIGSLPGITLITRPYHLFSIEDTAVITQVHCKIYVIGIPFLFSYIWPKHNMIAIKKFTPLNLWLSALISCVKTCLLGK